MLLACDPGIRGCGVAFFNEHTRKLIRAAYVKNADPTGAGLEEQNEMAKCILFWAEKGERGKVLDFGHYPTLVVEWMQIYPHMSQVNPNVSLLPLIGVVAHLSGARNWGERHFVRPHEWKGSVDGDVMVERILERLDAGEKASIEAAPKSVFHNAVDAVGIGLKHLDRLERKRLFRRA